MSGVWAEQLVLLPEYLSRHLLLSVTALVAGIGLSLPLAFASIRHRWLQGPVLTVASTIQTVPGLALLALMVPLLGRIGFVPAVIALVLYSMLPVLRNAITGIAQVDADAVEAARGLGMTRNQTLVKVQLPLALPVIMAGIRTAAVWVVGIATLSTPVGATSLGNFIFSGLQTQNYAAVVTGCVAAAALAIALDLMIRGIELALSRRQRRLIGATAVVTVAVLLAGLWPVLQSAIVAEERPRVVIGTKTFTEQYILGTLIANELQAAGFETVMRESLGSTVAFDALAADGIDLYVDYTGTIWANYMGRDDNPGRAAIATEVATWLRDEHGIEQAATLGFENAYALAMAPAQAERLGTMTIDDLVPFAPTLRLGGDYEFFGRPEWDSLAASYGLAFDALVTMDSTLMYSAVDSGEVDVITAFSTDGRIPAFDLVLLDDTRGALPPYDAVLLVAPTAESRVPGLRRVLGGLDNAIPAESMRAANRHVDLDGGTVAEAAAMLAADLVR